MYIFRCCDQILFRFVSKYRSESDVADALDVRKAGVKSFVDYDAPTQIDFDADTFEVEAFDV